MIIRKVKPLIPYFAHMRIVEDDGPFLVSGPKKSAFSKPILSTNYFPVIRSKNDYNKFSWRNAL